MYIIALDPGKTTGVAFLDYSEITSPTLVDHGSKSPENLTHTLDDYISRVGTDNALIVVERFVLREGMYGVDTSPIEVIGRIKEWSKDRPHPFVWQLPSEKELATNEVLRRMGLWLKGKDQRHVMDAVRHAVVYLVKQKHMPTLKKGWPQ